MGIFFYVFIFTCRSRAILWVILFSSYLKCGRYYPSSGYSNCLPRVCFTLRSNILLGCNCYYKFILYNPFYWGRLGPMNMGRICVDNATLTRFFSLHFLLPFAVAGLAGVHLLFLHQRTCLGSLLCLFLWELSVFSIPGYWETRKTLFLFQYLMMKSHNYNCLMDLTRRMCSGPN